MIIDKLAPFFTDHERAALRRAEDRRSEILDQLSSISWNDAAESNDQESTHLLADLRETEEAENALLLGVEQRYIDSFGGNPSAVLDDVRDIVDAIEKDDYIDYQHHITEGLRHIVENPQDFTDKKQKALFKTAQKHSRQNFDNCRRFILQTLRLQFNACAFYEDKSAEAEAVAIAEGKAETFYKRPKGAKPPTIPKRRELVLPTVHGGSTHGELLIRGTSPALNLVGEVLTVEDPVQLRKNKSQVNRNGKYTIRESGDKRQITYTNKGETINISVDNFRALANKSPQTSKVLTRILIRANEQALHNGVLTRNYVLFPLRELVGDGQYKTLESARHGFLTATDAITSIKITSKTTKGKRSLLSGGHATMFPSAFVNKSMCWVELSDKINWSAIIQYYTCLPDFYFELPTRAAILLDYIFYLARQNVRQIKEHGFFTISYNAIHSRLNLPDPESARNPRRDIKDAIELAVEQIEEKYSQYAAPIPKDATGADAEPEFSLLPMADYDAPVKQFLREGKLKVGLKGNYAARFIDISDRTAKMVEAARKRQERIQEKAAALMLAGEN